MTTTGIWNRETMSQQPTAINPMDSSGSSSSSSSASDGATISSNDFLTLLVTEMQNQDPTADTDPNEYINQLVNVNSLEQLISINQTLSSAMGTSDTTAISDAAGTSASTADANHDVLGAPTVASQSAAGVQQANVSPLHVENLHPVAGNLSIPEGSAAAQRVAKSLGGVS